MTTQTQAGSQHLAAARELLGEVTQTADADAQAKATAASAHAILVLAEQVAAVRLLLGGGAVAQQPPQTTPGAGA